MTNIDPSHLISKLTASPAQGTALLSVLAERAYQDEKWGDDNPHEIDQWHRIMQGQMHNLHLQIDQFAPKDNQLLTVLKICAVALACLEEHGVPNRSLQASSDASTQDK